MITLEELVFGHKTITNKRRPEFKQDQKHLRADILLQCGDPTISMTMFLRKLIDIPEDFSVGLRLNTPNTFLDTSVVLVRFQGPHGGQSINRNLNDLHNRYHIHLYSQEDFDRRRKRASVDKCEANFNSFEEAICQFLEYCHIEDPYDIFNHEREAINQFCFL